MEQTQSPQHEPVTVSHCYWHPSVETGLSCSMCGKNVCTQCMVQAPVGIRCKECGRPTRMPTYDVQASYYARAVGVALGVAIGGGILWALLNNIILGIPFLPGLVPLGVGYGSGELLSLSVNRKRSKGLAWLAGGAVVAAFLVSWLLDPYRVGIWWLLFLFLGVVLAVQRVRP